MVEFFAAHSELLNLFKCLFDLLLRFFLHFNAYSAGKDNILESLAF